MDIGLRIICSLALTACIFPSATINSINAVETFVGSLGDRFTLDKKEFVRFTTLIQRAQAIGAFDSKKEYNSGAFEYIEKYGQVTWLNSHKNHKPLLMAVHRMLSNEFINHIRYDTTRYLPEWVDIKNETDAISCIDRLSKFISTFANKNNEVIKNEIDRYIDDMESKYNISKKSATFDSLKTRIN